MPCVTPQPVAANSRMTEKMYFAKRTARSLHRVENALVNDARWFASDEQYCPGFSMCSRLRSGGACCDEKIFVDKFSHVPEDLISPSGLRCRNALLKSSLQVGRQAKLYANIALAGAFYAVAAGLPSRLLSVTGSPHGCRPTSIGFTRSRKMLLLSRKNAQQIVIGSDIVLTVVAVKGNRVTIGVEAPQDVKIRRSELPTPDLKSSGSCPPDPVTYPDVPMVSLTSKAVATTSLAMS